MLWGKLRTARLEGREAEEQVHGRQSQLARARGDAAGHLGVNAGGLRAAVAQYLADLGQRCALPQHVSGQGMPELMRATMRCVDLGPLECVAHDRTDAVRPVQQSADGHQRAKEEVPVLAGRPTVLPIRGDGSADIGEQRQQALPLTLAANPQLRLIPRIDKGFTWARWLHRALFTATA